VSSRELNPEIKYGTPAAETESASTPAKTNTPGGPGSSWRMMRLRRVYESAEEEGRDITEVGIERFGTLAAFQEAQEERRILDERAGKKAERGRTREGRGGGGEKGFIFNDMGSGASSRSSSFRRPGAMGDTTPSTPSPPSGAGPSSGQAPPANRRLDSLRLRSQATSPLAQSHTPIPSVMTPPIPKSKSRAMSPSSLNKLQAKVLRAKLMGAPNAEELEREYEEAARLANGGDSGEENVRTTVEVLPTLDGRGRMYDVGTGRDKDKEDDEDKRPGNRKKKEKVRRRPFFILCLI